MTNELQALRTTLAKGARQPKALLYAQPELRAQIATVAAGLLAGGKTWWGASKAIGISFQTLKKICETKPLRATNGHATNGHSTNGHTKNGRVRLTVHTANGHRVDDIGGPGPLALVTKDGHRVEGLTVETLAQLLARL